MKNIFSWLSALAVLATTVAAQASSSDDQIIELMKQRRLGPIHDYALAGRLPSTDIPKWMASITPTGQWPLNDVNYTNGCPAQRVGWPAAVHWRRLLVMACAYHGGVRKADGSADTDAEKWVGNAELREVMDRAMKWWFDNDTANWACMVDGGGPSCPCDSPGLWNTWYFINLLVVPIQASQACLMIDTPPNANVPPLTDEQRAGCSKIFTRSYNTIDQGYEWNTAGDLVMIARVGVDTALMNKNVTMLREATSRMWQDVSIKSEGRVDGIHPDGTFGQLSGVLYNGNYGKDYIIAAGQTALLTPGTPYAPPKSSVDALALLLERSKWMTFEDTTTGVVHWDRSVLGRFITYAVADGASNARLNLNMTVIRELGTAFNSNPILDFATKMVGKAGKSNSPGDLVGARMFQTMDYLVQRTDNYVSSLKMFSSRTLNSECYNAQNPFGFHLSDGLLYNYVNGNEYQDIIHAWDWHLLPGITVDYGRTALSCSDISYYGRESFVGGHATGNNAVGAMRYTNPKTGGLKFQKAWFFLGGGRQHVMVNNVWSNGDAPVLSVLDQKRRVGPLLVNGADVAGASAWDNGGSRHQSPSSFWHNNVGYVFKNSTASLVVRNGERNGNWSSIGISGRAGAPVDLVAAYLDHGAANRGRYTSVSYTTFLAVSSDAFSSRLTGSNPTGVQELRNDASVSAIFDTDSSTAYAVFWTGKILDKITFPGPKRSSLTVRSSAPITLSVDTVRGDITVADPSQKLSKVIITLEGKGIPFGLKLITFSLPTKKGTRGTSVAKNIFK